MVLAGTFTLGSLFLYNYSQASFIPVQGTTFYLAGSGITSSQTTIQLTSFQTPDGRAMTMSYFGSIGYGALEPGTSKLEDITFTGITQNGNGTATLTGVSRGQDFVTPFAATQSLAKAHSGGATFVLTNTAAFYGQQFAFVNNNQTFSGNNTFSGQTTFTNFPITPNNATSSINVAGISQLATTAQTAAGTATSTNGTNAPLVIANSTATSTYNAATAPNRVIVTKTNGTIDSNFLGTTTLAINATTTFSKGISIATSSITIGSFPAYQIGKNIQVFSTTGTTTFAIPSGVGTVFVQVIGGGGSGGIGSSCTNCSTGGGGGGGYAEGYINVSATTTVQVFTGTAGQWSTFGTNGFYMSAQPGSNNGTVTGGTTGQDGSGGGAGSGGNINISGSQGTFGLFSGSGHVGIGGQSAIGAGSYGLGGAGCTASSGTCSPGGGTQGIVIVRW